MRTSPRYYLLATLPYATYLTVGSHCEPPEPPTLPSHGPGTSDAECNFFLRHLMIEQPSINYLRPHSIGSAIHFYSLDGPVGARQVPFPPDMAGMSALFKSFAAANTTSIIRRNRRC